MSYKYPNNYNPSDFYKGKELYYELRGLEPLINPNLYLISNFGRIWNLEINSFIPMNLIKNINDYVRVQLKDINSKFYTHSVHKLVGFIFLGIPYSDEIFIDHKDGIKWHNEPYNLEQVTRSENINRSITLGTKPIQVGEESPNAILTNDQYNEVCKLIEDGLPPTEIDKKLNYNGISLINIVPNIRDGKTCIHISKNYDFSNAYHKYTSRVFTDEQTHKICKLLENNFNISTRNILKELGYNSDINVMEESEYQRFRSIIKAIKYKKRYKDISCNYNF